MVSSTDSPNQAGVRERPRGSSDLEALAGLLGEFRKGNIVAPRAERQGIERHARDLSRRWDDRFPGFPQQYFPFTSLRGLNLRGKRDAHLKNIVVRLVTAEADQRKLIVNLACVAGRHARDLASRLSPFKVIGTDIDGRWDWLYHRALLGRAPGNYEFMKDNVFEPKLDVTPTAVVFFGACGSVSDAAMDYAVDRQSQYLMCRTCCHDNIGGNTEIARRPTYVNWFFRSKNWGMLWYRGREKYAGFYFSDKYTKADYPRSDAARGVSTSDEFMAVSRHSPESDVCRAIIDLDRYLLLVEQGYRVWYRGELFVAEKAG